MRQSLYFSKTLKEAPKDEEAINSQLLIRAGFINKTMAGVYVYLPLGWRVLNKIENIVRDEMNKINGQEIFMPALHPRENWQKTGRWESFDALFKLKSKSGSEYALGPTHEEIIYAFLKNYISSYKDLPVYLYQIQTKFRDETRAKSGLLRNREFRMKDLYSFHTSDEDRNDYYEKVKNAYFKIFKRLELDVLITEASGGTFSDKSCEFQVVSLAGEDIIFVCSHCKIAYNREIISAGKIENKNFKCLHCGAATEEKKAIEVGNIFPLKEKFAKDFNLVFKDENGNEKFVSAGCYGFGSSRAMGTVVETRNDKKGIIWPKEIAPFEVHLVNLSKVNAPADKIYETLQGQNIEIIYDDRIGMSAGEKLVEADLIGILTRIVVSDKTLVIDSVEVKKRDSNKVKLVKIKELTSFMKHEI